MEAQRKITEAEWNLHKARLQSLYITDNRTLEQVITLAASDYGFQARLGFAIYILHFVLTIRDTSKTQYIRQFKKWGFEKNAKSNQWKEAIGDVHKRKSQGKDSEVYIKDKLISNKKLRKEMSRHHLSDIVNAGSRD